MPSKKPTATPYTSDDFDNGASAGTADAPVVHSNADANGGEFPAERANAVDALERTINADSLPDTQGAPATPVSASPDAHSGERTGEVDFAAMRRNATMQNAAEPSGGEVPFLDLSKADEIAALIPKGTRVLVTVMACDPKLSSAGNPMLNYRVAVERVTQRAADDTTPDDVVMMWRKRSLFGRFMFTPPNPITGSRGTMNQSQAAFKAFGVPWASRPFATRNDFMVWLAEVAPQFIGAIAEATIGIDVSDPNKPESYDMATGELYPDKNTAYGFREHRNAPRAPATPVRPASNQPQTVDSDEDLPF